MGADCAVDVQAAASGLAIYTVRASLLAACIVGLAGYFYSINLAARVDGRSQPREENYGKFLLGVGGRAIVIAALIIGLGYGIATIGAAISGAPPNDTWLYRAVPTVSPDADFLMKSRALFGRPLFAFWIAFLTSLMPLCPPVFFYHCASLNGMPVSPAYSVGNPLP